MKGIFLQYTNSCISIYISLKNCCESSLDRIKQKVLKLEKHYDSLTILYTYKPVHKLFKFLFKNHYKNSKFTRLKTENSKMKITNFKSVNPF